VTTYVIRNGRLIEKHRAAPLSVDPRMHVISDVMPATRHPITGKLMDSKSEFRKITRAHGCIEVGNDKWPERKPIESPPVRPDLVRTIRQLMDR
jgi:hypothetical protein